MKVFNKKEITIIMQEKKRNCSNIYVCYALADFGLKEKKKLGIA